MDNKIILIVEDDLHIIELLTYNLGKEGFNVIALPNGETVLELASKIKPDLILLDLMMPGLNGHEILHLLKRNMRLYRIPVIIISALINKEVINKSFDLKAAEYIAKPFNVKE
ncbi:MAG: response regulator, partial [Candidatus Methylomirabilota bacterium]